MMKLTLSLAQMGVAIAQPDRNLEKGEGLVAEAARRGSDLVCFPEMWTTGFDWAQNERLARERQDVVGRIGEMARRHAIWIGGSVLALNPQGQVANTFVLFDNMGRQAGLYRKTHLFSLLHEDRYMAPGESLVTVPTPWGKAGLAVCYDVRFPEMFRTYALQGCAFVLLPAAFPHPRLDHWKVLVPARAIENQMYMVAVNRAGREDFGPDGEVTYFGHSLIVDPWGQTVVAAVGEGEELLTATIDLDESARVRSAMTVFQDRRPELYRLS